MEREGISTDKLNEWYKKAQKKFEESEEGLK